MAEIFTRIFGEKLAKENLVELNNLDRLPSPHQLQGKIILKGTEPLVKSPRRSVRRNALSYYIDVFIVGLAIHITNFIY